MTNTASSSTAPQREYPKWRPEDRYVAHAVDPKMEKGGVIQMVSHGIPASNRFALSATPSPGEPDLSRLDLSSRLDLHAHATRQTFDEHTAEDLAKLLQDRGLAQVGVLKLQGCRVGKGHFLGSLRAEFDTRGMQVGYLSGFTTEMTEWRSRVKVGNVSFNVAPYMAVAIAPKTSCFPWIPADAMLKTVKGNVDIAFPGTRYNLPDSIGPRERAVFDDLATLSAADRFKRLHAFLTKLPDEARPQTAQLMEDALRVYRDEFSVAQTQALLAAVHQSPANERRSLAPETMHIMQTAVANALSPTTGPGTTATTLADAPSKLSHAKRVQLQRWTEGLSPQLLSMARLNVLLTPEEWGRNATADILGISKDDSIRLGNELIAKWPKNSSLVRVGRQYLKTHMPADVKATLTQAVETYRAEFAQRAVAKSAGATASTSAEPGPTDPTRS